MRLKIGIELKLKKITLVGITHIDASSQEKVTRVLNLIKPDAVCLELDEYRLKALIENDEINKSSFFVDSIDENQNEEMEKIQEDQSIGNFSDEINFGESFSAILDDIGFFESELARITKTDLAGKEMLVAYEHAKEIGAEIYLIDRSIHDISKVMEEELSVEEAQKFQSLIDELMYDRTIIAQPAEKILENKEKNNSFEDLISDDENEEINLNEVLEVFKDEDSLTNILQIFNQNFPKLYSILLEDRNVFMSKEIMKVVLKHSNIVVIVGYGHLKEMKSILTELNNSIQIEIAE
ncbi:MAG: hypothetical protein FK733_14230 [Asgard group archaeon]|nr:hypothetical protein [Asgard group archaeon]